MELQCNAVGDVEASTRERRLRSHMCSVSCRARLCSALCLRWRETLLVVLCVGANARAHLCACLSFYAAGEAERGRECSSALPCPSLREPSLRPVAVFPVSFVCASLAFALTTHRKAL